MALGIGLVLVGSTLIWLPLATYPVAVFAVGSGNWSTFEVPGSATLVAAEVRVVVNWSAPAGACEGPIHCVNYPPFVLTVVDCGRNGCPDLPETSGAYGTEYSGNSAGQTSFDAIPGHHYALGLDRTYPGNRLFSVAYFAPVAGGWFGVGLLASGLVVSIYSLSRPKMPRPRHPGF